MSAKYIKAAVGSLARPLCTIINTSITEGSSPDPWKLAKAIPIHKGGCKSDRNNYRPISILNTLSKMIESHVHDSFYYYLNQHDLISRFQYGFRRYHSCETSLARLTSERPKQIVNGNLIGCVNIDLRKAFD